MNRREQDNLDMLDILSILGFVLQVQNIQENKEETKYIHNFIYGVANEIEKLHKENDIIMNKIDKILERGDC